MQKPKRSTQARSRERAPEPVIGRLQEVALQLAKDPKNAALWEEKGLALADHGFLRESLAAFSRGLLCDPFRGSLYLERGHRHINLGELEEAAADLFLASRLLPDSWGVYYHLGLANYLLGLYPRAEAAFRFGIRLSDIDDRLIPMLHWLWVTLVHAGKMEDAAQVLEKAHGDMDAPDNWYYLKKLLLFKGELTPEDLLPGGELSTEVVDISAAYGISNYYYFLRQDEEASRLYLDKLLEAGKDEAWLAFSYLAAESEPERRAAAFKPGATP